MRTRPPRQAITSSDSLLSVAYNKSLADRPGRVVERTVTTRFIPIIHPSSRNVKLLQLVEQFLNNLPRTVAAYLDIDFYMAKFQRRITRKLYLQST